MNATQDGGIWKSFVPPAAAPSRRPLGTCHCLAGRGRRQRRRRVPDGVSPALQRDGRCRLQHRKAGRVGLLSMVGDCTRTLMLATNNRSTNLKFYTYVLCACRSTNNTDVIKLAPINTDYDRMCGYKLEFQVRSYMCLRHSSWELKGNILQFCAHLTVPHYTQDYPGKVRR